MELKYVKRGEIAIYSPRPLVISKMCGHHQKLGYRDPYRLFAYFTGIKISSLTGRYL
jgi:GDP-D-mannose dehydratase